LFVAILVQENQQIKTASLLNSVYDWVSQYIQAHIDPDNKVASVLNLLAPGILYAMGFKWLSFLLELAESIFGFDLKGIFASIINAIREPLSNGTITPEHIDEAAQAAVGITAQSATLRELQLIKTTLQPYFNGSKVAQAGILSLLKPKTGSILARVIGWVFKGALASAGLMVLGDASKKMLGKPSPLSAHPLETAETSGAMSVKSTQTLFKSSPDYQPEHFNITSYWIEMLAEPSEIGQTIISWMHDIYPETQKLPDSVVQSLPAFQKVVDTIQAYNSKTTGNYTFIPKQFTSRKQIVDTFIDQLAAHAPETKSKDTPSAHKPAS
jgi:hypothetical protein